MTKKVTCPYTHGEQAMEEENKPWCMTQKGQRCDGKDCRWKDAKVKAEEVVIVNITQRKLF